MYSSLGYRIFKLCDRKQTTSWIIHTLQSYVSEHYDGNLAEIMAPWNRHEGTYGFPQELNRIDFESVSADKLRNHLRFMPSIDNRSLDGYLNYWREQKPSGCRDEDCDTCGYCAQIAAIALQEYQQNNRIIVRNVKTAIEISTSIDPESKGGKK